MSFGVDTLGLLTEKLKQLVNETQDNYESFFDSTQLFKQGKMESNEYFSRMGEFLVSSSALNFLSCRVILELKTALDLLHISTMGQSAFNYLELPIPERVQLVEDIWDSIAREANARADALPLTESQRAELNRRVTDANAHPESSVPWETLRDELFKRGG